MTSADKCGACNGTGQVVAESSLGKSRMTCSVCKGTGSKGDNLSKVIPQPDFDLKK